MLLCPDSGFRPICNQIDPMKTKNKTFRSSTTAGSIFKKTYQITKSFDTLNDKLNEVHLDIWQRADCPSDSGQNQVIERIKST